MKVTVYLACAIFALLACKKEKVDTPELIGNWGFYGLAREYEDGYITGVEEASCFYGPYSDEEFGQVELEITEKGEFIFNSKKGKEKFQLVSKENRTSTIVLFECPSHTYTSVVVDGYNFTLRNKSGKKFQFPCFYIPSHDVLVIVPWVKGVLYNSTDRVYYEELGKTPFYHTSSIADYTPGFYQFLGHFNRL